MNAVSSFSNTWGGKRSLIVMGFSLAVLCAMPAAAADDQASVVMQLIPGEVYAGQQFAAVIQIKNTGANTWTRDAGYHLATVGGADWGVKRIELAGPVASDETATFKAQLTAPDAPGEHVFQWQMRRAAGAFGEAAPRLEVTVLPRDLSRDDAEFVFQDVSQTMLAGETHQVAIQFKNIGRSAWRAGRVSLASPRGEGLIWALDHVEMAPGQVIEPGAFLVFRFNVQAPPDPGHYPFQWQLHHARDGLFGRPSEGLVIDVR